MKALLASFGLIVFTHGIWAADSPLCAKALPKLFVSFGLVENEQALEVRYQGNQKLFIPSQLWNRNANRLGTFLTYGGNGWVITDEEGRLTYLRPNENHKISKDGYAFTNYLTIKSGKLYVYSSPTFNPTATDSSFLEIEPPTRVQSGTGGLSVTVMKIRKLRFAKTYDLQELGHLEVVGPIMGAKLVSEGMQTLFVNYNKRYQFDCAGLREF